MDYNLACKGSCECEKHGIGDLEANIESYDSEPEEGEIRVEDGPSGSESPIHKDTSASAIELSSSAQGAVEKEQVHIRQLASPQRASQGGTASTVFVQQSKFSVIYKDMATTSAEEAIEKEQVNIRQSTSPERGSHLGGTASTIFVQQSKCSAIHKDMAARSKELSTSAQGVVEEELSTSPERSSHQGGTASTAIVQQSKYTASEGQHVNVWQSTLNRTCCWKQRRSYSPSIYSSSKERHKKRKHGCFRYSDYQWVLKRIEEVCSERFSNLLLRQIRDRKKFKTVRKEQELEFFQEHVHSYKVHYTHVMPTIRYCRRRLPKLHFNILRQRFHKHMQSQLIKFVKQQINDRNKENRIKDRWIFEAKAGYLKKCFYVISLSYSEFKLEKLEWHMTDYSDGEEHLKYFDMQSLTTQIEEIASNGEPEGTFASDVSEPILEKSLSLLETNGATKLVLSVGVTEKMFTIESRSSQSTCASKFGEKDGTQIALSAAAPENVAGNMERPDASESVTSAALEPAKAVTAGKASDVSEPILENSQLPLESNGATKVGFSVGVAEEMATLESSSSRSTCAPAVEFGEKDGTHIAFSTAAQNEAGNMERPCASWFAMNAALELAMTVTTDSENAASISKEKRRRISSGNDISEDPCSRPQTKFGENDGAQITFSTAAQNEGGNVERPTASRSVTNAPSELAMTVNTDSENAPPTSKEKRRRISSSNDISEGPYSRSQIQFPYESTPNICRTALPHEEPPAARPPPPLVNINQMNSDQTSSFAQVTEQPNMHSNTQSVTNQHHCGSTCRAASHPYQTPGGNTHSVRNGIDILGASNVCPASANQVPTGSTPEQFVTEDGHQSDPLAIELSRLQMLHDLIAKRHKEKREQLLLARQIELAQAKRKYDELMYNSEVEVLQRKRDLKIKSDKIYKQQILAEVFQVIFKASARVVPDSPRGAAQRTMAEPNRSSDQHIFQLPASISTPAAAAMYHSPQLSAQASSDASLRQHSVATQQTAMDSWGRPTTTLMHNPSGSRGNGLAYHRQGPHHRSFVNSVPASVLHPGVASSEE